MLRHTQKLATIPSTRRTLIWRRNIGTTPSLSMAMKPGTVLEPLGVLKGQDPPVVKERAEYPAWVDSLAKPLPNLAKLRKIPNEEAKDREIMRYLKLIRRQTIRQNNEEAGSK